MPLITDYRHTRETHQSDPSSVRPQQPLNCDHCKKKARKRKYRINQLNASGAKMFCSQSCKDAYIQAHPTVAKPNKLDSLKQSA